VRNVNFQFRWDFLSLGKPSCVCGRVRVFRLLAVQRYHQFKFKVPTWVVNAHLL